MSEPLGSQPIKKQSFLQGTAILALGTILVKLMGFLFKTPLNNIIGSTGFGYFNSAYDVYNVLLMISTTGLPVAMSRMISEAQALGNEAQIRRIFKTAIYVFLAIGIVGSLVMLVFCRPLSVLVSNSENSWAAIAALAPCVLLICMISAYRGFFQGQSNMTPTSVSQVFESITRLVVGLALAWLIMKLTGERCVRENGLVLAPGESALQYGDMTLAAGGAILGVTLGCLVSVLYLHGKFRRASAALTASAAGTPKTGKATMKELLSIAVPITLGSAGLQIINLFDTMIYMRRLEDGLGWSVAQAESLKGVYNYQQTIFALPCAFIPTITIACIPAITAALTRKDHEGVRATIAVPITLGSAGLQIINLFDTMIYMRRLEDGLGWSVAQAESLKGVYNYQQTIFALPCAFIPTITIACIPAITAALTRKDHEGVRATEESALRTMALISMPCAAGLFCMAEPVIRLLCRYSADELAVAVPMLSILGIAVIFNSLVLLLNAFMQAHGDVTSPVINMLIGGIVKIAVNFVLVGIPSINIVGAPAGTLLCYIVITILNIRSLRKSVRGGLPIVRNLIRPLLASALMGAATFMVYRVLAHYLPSVKLACLAALVFAVCVYLVLAVALRCITYEDCMLLPKGEKIAKILRIRQK